MVYSQCVPLFLFLSFLFPLSPPPFLPPPNPLSLSLSCWFCPALQSLNSGSMSGVFPEVRCSGWATLESKLFGRASFTQCFVELKGKVITCYRSNDRKNRTVPPAL